MKIKSWKVSVLKRLIISFVCILSPIYILSIFIYNSGIKILRQEISNSMTSQLSSYMDNLEKEVQRIRTLQFELLNDRDINRIATIPQSLSIIDTVQSLLRIQQRLYALKNSSKYIKEVYVMVPAAGKFITSLSISEFDQYMFNKMKRFPWMPEGEIVYIEDSMFLNIPFPGLYFPDQEPIGIISIELSKTAFEEALATMINNTDEGIILYHTANRKSIVINDQDHLSHQLIHFKEQNNQEAAEVVVINQNSYLVVYKMSNYFQSVLIKYIPEKSVFKTLESYRVWFILIIVSALVIITVYSAYIYNFIHKPLSRLVKAFNQVKKGNFKIHIQHEYDDEFRYIYSHFNEMVSDLDTLIDQVFKQKMLVQKAEMKQLQSQINPHFLYNSFFILNTMARIGDYESLEKFTEQLGQYFQFVTRNAADEISLLKEVNHARVYTDIQAMRYANRIKVEFDLLPEDFEDLMVPRLILQPIIENAFEHGLGKKSKDGYLAVKFNRQCEEYQIIVENNGEDIDDNKLLILQKKLSDNKKEEEVTALQNIHQRLQLKFGAGSGLFIEKGDISGLKVMICIRYKGEREGYV
ncbi:MAG: histidine kinase [Clostridiaceae bacterium]|nr:histidine kinase [Clostridiaceae bacterium]